MVIHQRFGVYLVSLDPRTSANVTRILLEMFAR